MDAQRRHALRHILGGGIALALPGALARSGFAQDLPRSPIDAAVERSSYFGPPRPFDAARLIAHARALAATPFVPPVVRHGAILDRIGYDAHAQITMRHDRELWRDSGRATADLFILANLFRTPVRIHAVDGGTAREILFDPALFAYGPAAPRQDEIPEDLGFAGFRLREQGTRAEFAAFLGASYFRSPGQSGQYGISARGLAIDTGLAKGEEFPSFTAFWLEPAEAGSLGATVHALLEGPSATGAYRFGIASEDGTIMDVAATLFFRAGVSRLGIAPLTSMYWYGKHDHHRARGWRPAVHDSDGLSLWTGAGERIWRPLVNPPQIQVSAFADQDPRGFGLMQRDRDFASYEDTGALYDRRPSLWVEPREAWGAGDVLLIELPTAGEFNDNVVAFWRSDRKAEAGAEWALNYRLHWRDDEPFAATPARCIATRTGTESVREKGFTKIVVDFAGPSLADLPEEAGPDGEVEFVLSAPRGTFKAVHTLKLAQKGGWRGVLEFAPEGGDPVDIRGFLRRGDEALTETWLYRFLPAG